MLMYFYAVSDAVTGFDEMGKEWGVSPGQALMRLIHLGLDVVEQCQLERVELHGVPPPMPYGWELPDPWPRFAYFADAARRAGLPKDAELPPGSRSFVLSVDAGVTQRLRFAALRENAWRAAGRDQARPRPTASLHSLMGWSSYEGLVLVGHRLYKATKPHQMRRAELPVG